MKRLKKRIAICATICFSAFAVYISMASLKYNDNYTNEIRTGLPEFHVTLTDIFTPPGGIGGQEPVNKTVTVKNDGSIPAFVRVLVMPVVLSKDNIILKAQIGEEIIIHDLNTTEWQDGGDGYYYYLYQLLPSEQAPCLFNTVSLNLSQPGEYKDAALSIQIKMESVAANKYSYRAAWWNGYIPDSLLLKQIDNALQSRT